MVSLQWLDLSENQFTSLPPELGALSQLRELYLSCNQLTSLPSQFGKLSSLQWLNLNNNSLTTLPPNIGLLSSLQRLQLKKNLLLTLPYNIGQLSSLKYLDISDNKISSLPPEFLNLSLSLKTLCVNKNSFERLMTTTSTEIQKLSFNGPATLLDICCTFVVRTNPSLTEIETVTELKERLKDQVRVCSGCHRSFFGDGQLDVLFSATVAHQSVPISATFCTVICGDGFLKYLH